jgi:hypothetical protein
MAAIFYRPVNNSTTLFKSGVHVNTAVRVPFLNRLVGGTGFAIVTEVTTQMRDTIQYFLTFDDLISYFYFGKGLGNISISGMLFSDCSGHYPGLNQFTDIIAGVRGTTQNISFGNAVFSGVVSSFTLRAVGEDNTIEFNIQLDVVDHSLLPPRFTPSC